MTVWVDDRWRGPHGIGRYAAEVLPRLGVAWQSLRLRGNQSSPLDLFQRLPRGAHKGLIYSPGYSAFLASRRELLTVHDLIHLQVDWPMRAKYLAYYNGPLRRTVRQAGILFTVSDTSRRHIKEWLRDDSVEVVVTGAACSSAFHPDGPREVSGDPYVFFIGNLRRHKNVDVILEAFRGIEGITLKALLPKREIVEARARVDARGIADRVELIHSADDASVARLYRGAAATVMPSLVEGFGLPPLESIRCGTPVLYWTGCEAVKEVVGTEGTAVDSATDSEEWAARIREVVASGMRTDPGAAVHYDWDATAATITAAIRRRQDA